jgi:hypothetical protein
MVDDQGEWLLAYGLTTVLTEGVRAKLFVSIELKQTINRSP